MSKPIKDMTPCTEEECTAAEIYAVSVSLNEMLHLGYVTDKMGFTYPTPIELCVDNSTAVAFCQGQMQCSKMRHMH